MRKPSASYQRKARKMNNLADPRIQFSTQAALRRAFWAQAGVLADFYKASYRQNDYSATVRCEWCDYVESCARNGIISDALAQRVTL
jgi:hypothetical protein